MKRNVLLENRWLKLFEDKFKLENGAPCTYYHVERSDAVMAIAVELDAESNDLYTFIVKQYRHPAQAALWQFPLGGLDSADERPEQVALRELKEETGLIAATMQHVGSIYADPGFSSQRMHVCITSDIKAVSGQQLEQTEVDLVCQKVSLGNLDSFLETHQMQDAWSICGVHFLRAFLESNQLNTHNKPSVVS